MINVQYKNHKLFVLTDGKSEIIGHKVSNVYYVSLDMNKVLYLENSTNWYSGDLYIKEGKNERKLIDKNVKLVYVTSDLNKIVYLKESNVSVEPSLPYIKIGDLKTFLNLYYKRCIDKDVYPIIAYIENRDGRFGIFYTKRKRYDNYKLFYFDEDGKINKIAEDVKNYFIMRTFEDKLRVVSIKEVPNSICLNKAFVYEQEKGERFLEYISSNSYYVNSNSSEFHYFKSDNIKKNTFTHYAIPFCNIKNKKVIEVAVEEKAKQHTMCFHNTRTTQNITDSILNAQKEFRLYFRKVIGKRYYMALELVKRAKIHKIIKSEYEYDDSENHIAIFGREQLDNFLLLAYVLEITNFRPGVENRLWGYHIYGVDVKSIIMSCNNIQGNTGGHYYDYKNGACLISDGNSYRAYVEQVRDRLMQLQGFTYKKQLETYLTEKYVKTIDEAFEFSSKWYMKLVPYKSEQQQKLKNQYEELETKLISENKLPLKWKSENALFKLIDSNFSGVRLHYSPYWLKPQHIDIFVENLNLAFEYQGIQHYKPVDYFGGINEFKHRVALDKRKKELCSKYGVKLIQWLYNEPITKIQLKKKLNELNL